MSSKHAQPGSSVGEGFFASRGLVRTPQDRKVAGVCACLARVSGFEPVLWRVIFSVFVLFNGIGAALYLLCWLFIPSRKSTPTMQVVLGTAGVVLLGIVFVATDVWSWLVFCALGGSLFALAHHQKTTNFTPSAAWDPRAPAPDPATAGSSGPFEGRSTSLSEDADLARFDTATMPAATYPTDTYPAAGSPGGRDAVTAQVPQVTDMPGNGDAEVTDMPGNGAGQDAEVTDMPQTRTEPAAASSWDEPADTSGFTLPQPAEPDDAAQPNDAAAPRFDSELAAGSTAMLEPQPGQPHQPGKKLSKREARAQLKRDKRAEKERRAKQKAAAKQDRGLSRIALGAVTFSLILVAMSVMLIVSLAGVSIPFGAYVGVALILCGCGLVFGTWFGRSPMLYFASVVLAALMAANIALAGAGVTGTPLQWNFVQPASVSHVSDVVEVNLASTELDLHQLSLDPSDTVAFDAVVRGGTLVVLVPQDATVVVDTQEKVASDLYVDGEWFREDGQMISPGSDSGGEVAIAAYLIFGSLEVARV